jgi:hypothetical protein
MPADLYTENLVASFLMLADFDTSTSIDEILSRLDDWQIQNDRHFGIHREDIRIAMTRLFWHELRLPGMPCGFEQASSKFPLADCILPLLEFGSVYCNDESSHWWKKDPVPGLFEQGESRSYRNHEMRKFFARPENHDHDKVAGLLHRFRMGPESMIEWSRPGESS